MRQSAADERIRIGCQSWGYEDWVTRPAGDHIFYPPGTKKAEMLAAYSRVFDTIEVDATLYGIPASTTLEKWHRETPDDFKFSLKFPREVTHDRRLAPESLPVMREFCERARLLGDKLAMMLIQLPPSFEGSKENAQNLRRLLNELPRDQKFAVEFRHRDWFIDWTYRELEAAGASLCLVEGPWLPREVMFDAIGKVTADRCYIRIMGERDLERFDRIYRRRDDVLEQWAANIRRIEADEIYVYCDNYFEGFAPATANKLLRLLGLGERDFDTVTRQKSLF
ncbi:MAG: DUF72 domain-containing protein [Pyrinomonadaceae bacterium]